MKSNLWMTRAIVAPSGGGSYNLPMLRRAWPVLRVLFAVAVVVGVGYHFRKSLDDPEQILRAVRVEYLIPAGVLYLLAHTVWGTFWWQLLRYEALHVSWPRAIATYFISQFGKYVPGKAWVIVLRIAMLGKDRQTRRIVGVTGVFETLTSMAAGALIGVALLPMTGLKLPPEADNLPLFIALAGVPLAVFLLLKIAQKVVNARKGPDAPPLPVPSLGLLALGLLQDALGWCLLTVSLWLTVTAIVPAPSLTTLAAAVTLSYVAGFVILVAPGGLGAREWVLSVILAASMAKSDAVMIAILLRLTWTTAEVVLAGLLWLVMKKSR